MFIDRNVVKKETARPRIVIEGLTQGGCGSSVGAIQKLTAVHNRQLSFVKVEQPDGTIKEEIVPGPATVITLEAERIVIDGLSFSEAVGQPISLATHEKPFKIKISQMPNQEGTLNGPGVTTTTYHNCWFQSYTSIISVDNYFICERAVIVAESVSVLHPQK